MDHRLGAEDIEDAVERLGVADVGLMRLEPAFGHQFAHPAQRLGRAVGIIVDAGHLVALPQKLHQRMAADVACSTCHENAHNQLSDPVAQGLAKSSETDQNRGNGGAPEGPARHVTSALRR